MWTRRKGSEEEEEELEEEEEEEAEIEDEDNYEQDSDEQLTFDVSTKLSRCFDQEGFTVKLVVGASQGASEAENWPQAAQWMECIKLSDHGASLLQHTQNAALAAMDARLALQAAGHDAGNENDYTEFKVWSTLLRQWSDVFGAMLDSHMVEAAGRIQIEDFSPQTVKKALQFMHSGSLGVWIDGIVEVGAFADKYGILELKNLVRQALQKGPRANVSARDIARMNLPALDLKNLGCTLYDLRSLNFTAHELKNARFSASELKSVGYPLKDLIAAGYGRRRSRSIRLEQRSSRCKSDLEGALKR